MHPVIVEALKHLGTHNGAPFLLPLGLKPPASWCLAFVLACWTTAVPSNNLPHTARCFTFWENATANPMRYEVGTPEDVAWGIYKIRPSDVVVISHDPTVHDWQGHAGLVMEDLGGGRVRTVEGNTSPNDKGDQRNGGTVAIKVRRTGVMSFWVMGYVRSR
jgi:hypothetical protein